MENLGSCLVMLSPIYFSVSYIGPTTFGPSQHTHLNNERQGSVSVFEAAAVGPEAEAGVGDEEDLLAIDRVPAIFEPLGVVLRGVGGEVAVLEVDALDLLLGEVSRAVADSEAAFARAVDEMGG